VMATIVSNLRVKLDGIWDGESYTGKWIEEDPIATTTGKFVYKADTKTVDESQGCELCKKSDSSSNNDIFFCDFCDKAFHQNCYDIVSQDSSDHWYCNDCLSFRENVGKNYPPSGRYVGYYTYDVPNTTKIKDAFTIQIGYNWKNVPRPKSYDFQGKDSQTGFVYKLRGRIMQTSEGMKWKTKKAFFSKETQESAAPGISSAVIGEISEADAGDIRKSSPPERSSILSPVIAGRLESDAGDKKKKNPPKSADVPKSADATSDFSHNNRSMNTTKVLATKRPAPPLDLSSRDRKAAKVVPDIPVEVPSTPQVGSSNPLRIVASAYNISTTFEMSKNLLDLFPNAIWSCPVDNGTALDSLLVVHRELLQKQLGNLSIFRAQQPLIDLSVHAVNCSSTDEKILCVCPSTEITAIPNDGINLAPCMLNHIAISLRHMLKYQPHLKVALLDFHLEGPRGILSILKSAPWTKSSNLFYGACSMVSFDKLFTTWSANVRTLESLEDLLSNWVDHILPNLAKFGPSRILINLQMDPMIEVKFFADVLAEINRICKEMVIFISPFNSNYLPSVLPPIIP